MQMNYRCVFGTDNYKSLRFEEVQKNINCYDPVVDVKSKFSAKLSTMKSLIFF